MKSYARLAQLDRALASGASPDTQVHENTSQPPQTDASENKALEAEGAQPGVAVAATRRKARSSPEYMRNYMRLRARRFRADIVASLGGKCAKCSSTDRLQVDHIDPAQKVSHRITTWSVAKRNEELAKCQLLCHRCHWDKTISERRARREKQAAS